MRQLYILATLGFLLATSLAVSQIVVDLRTPPNQPSVQMNQLPQQVQSSSSSQNVTILQDIAGTNHSLVGTSSPGQGLTPGLTYLASTNTVISNYTIGQYFIFMPDVPVMTGATLNIDGIGPVLIVGACNKVCLIIYYQPIGLSMEFAAQGIL